MRAEHVVFGTGFGVVEINYCARSAFVEGVAGTGGGWGDLCMCRPCQTRQWFLFNKMHGYVPRIADRFGVEPRG